jgi:nicotinamidase-related amidase
MIMKAKSSCLLVIDMQEKLLSAIPENQIVIANAVWLIQIAMRLEVPILMSEQYPKGLGHTVKAVRELVPQSAIMEKVCFSCTEESTCMQRLDAWAGEQLILVGIEAHVCVLQTALGLLGSGKQVYVVADGTASRRALDAELAMARLRAEGVRIVTREMVAFEWLQQAGTDQFRDISRNFLR